MPKTMIMPNEDEPIHARVRLIQSIIEGVCSGFDGNLNLQRAVEECRMILHEIAPDNSLQLKSTRLPLSERFVYHGEVKG